MVALASSLLSSVFVDFVKGFANSFYRHIPRFRHIPHVLISIFIIFMRTEICCLARICFHFLFWTVVSLYFFCFFLYLFPFVRYSIFALQVLSLTLIISFGTNFCFCIVLGHYLAVLVLSLSWFWLLLLQSFFLHSIFFAFFLAFLLVLAFLFPPFSLSLSLSLSLDFILSFIFSVVY